MTITYGSVCSGIEAATCAWHPLGWKAEWFAEIEPFPSALLAHRWPKVTNHGDMTKLAQKILSRLIPAPAVTVGGTPCQDFSVAGMRAGLAGERGALTISYVELIDAIDHVRTSDGDPECVAVWENVPGVLSDKGNAFGCFLGALVGESDALQPSGGKWTDAGCVYGPKRSAAWRVLDAQYFGLAQRRRRVFVVSSARAGFDPAAVLFEREGVRRDTAPRRGEGQDLAGRAPFGPALQCGCGHIHDLSLGAWGCPDCEGDEGPSVEVMAGIPAFGGENQGGSLFQAGALNAHGVRHDFATETFCVAPTIAGGGRKRGGYSHDDIPLTAGTILANGKAAGSATTQDAENGLLVVHGTQDQDVQVDQAHTLGRNHGQENAVLAFAENSRSEVRLEGGDGQVVGTLSTGGGKPGQGHPCIATYAIQNATRGKDQNGLGIAADSPMYTLDQASQHAVFAIQAGALRTNPLSGPDGIGVQADHAYTLEARAEVQAIAVALRGREGGATAELGDDLAGTLRASTGGGDKAHALVSSAVRRLTPTECERLQGFEDDYTLIAWRGKPAEECPDGPRYKAIGNSKAVPVVRWIGRRIQRELERAV